MWDENYEFNFNCRSEVNNRNEANVLPCGKTKLCRVLNSFGMFTLIPFGAAGFV